MGHVPTFFVGAGVAREEITMNAPDSIVRRVEAALARELPAVDLLEVSEAGPETLRVTVDHPDGVDHGVCADVTHVLEADGLLDQYGIEVWSPGPEPPLRTPEHFRRAVGRQVRIRVRGAHGGAAPSRYAGGGGRPGAPVVRRADADGDPVLRGARSECPGGFGGVGMSARALVGAVGSSPVVVVQHVRGSTR